MGISIKVAILERDGVEYDGVVEYDFRQAFLEAVGNAGNYHKVPTGIEFEIGEDLQVINYGGLTIDGQLTINGSLVII